MAEIVEPSRAERFAALRMEFLDKALVVAERIARGEERPGYGSRELEGFCRAFDALLDLEIKAESFGGR